MFSLRSSSTFFCHEELCFQFLYSDRRRLNNIKYKYYSSKREIVPDARKGKKLFTDWKKVRLKAGNGGDGSASFIHSRDHRGGPNGGNGGKGGSIIAEADNNYTDFSHLNYHYAAGNGANGLPKNKHGRNGKNVVLKVPIGSEIRVFDSGTVIADLVKDAQSTVLVSGGEPGFGNVYYKSSLNVRPQQFGRGELGNEIVVEMELKSIADIAFVGFPNSGKSTLLSTVSRATPKVAPYPFTTLKPSLGIVHLSGMKAVVVADIPGLVSGAHKNKGLGHVFLRHVERCRYFVYVIDSSCADLVHQFESLQLELDMYRKNMSLRPSLLVANKIDLLDDHETTIKTLRSHVKMPVIALSAKYGKNISLLKNAIRNFITT